MRVIGQYNFKSTVPHVDCLLLTKSQVAESNTEKTCISMEYWEPAIQTHIVFLDIDVSAFRFLASSLDVSEGCHCRGLSFIVRKTALQVFQEPTCAWSLEL